MKTCAVDQDQVGHSEMHHSHRWVLGNTWEGEVPIAEREATLEVKPFGRMWVQGRPAVRVFLAASAWVTVGCSLYAACSTAGVILIFFPGVLGSRAPI